MRHAHRIAIALLLLYGASCKPEGPAATPTTGTPGANTPAPPAAGDKMTWGGVPPAKSDTLMLSYSNDPDTINPVTANDTVSDDFIRWVYEGLATRKNENPDEWMGVLAESWEFDEKTLEYRIKLRKGVKWHPMTLPDGSPLPAREFTAKDVKFTFDCILNKHVAAASLRSYYEDPEATEESKRIKISVQVVDDYTIHIKWTKPYFLSKEFTLGIAVIPRHVFSVDEKGEPISLDFSSKEFADGFNNHWANSRACGTGPMILTEWKKDERVVLKRNPEYWGPPFYFNQAVFRAIANPNTDLQLLLQNELDWSKIPNKDHYVQSKDHANVTGGKVKLVEYPYPVYRYVGYNQDRELFKDRKVRRALGHAVPMDQIIEKVYFGLAQRTSGPFLVGSSAYNSKLAPLAYDLNQARALLDEAGWKDSDGDGLRDKMISGKKVDARFDLMIYSDSPQYKTIAEILRENYRQIGVDAQISPAKWQLMLQKTRKKEFDAVMLGWALGWQQDPFQIWHSSQADVEDSSNSIGYRNPEVDKLIEQLRVTFDTQKQIEIYHEIHRIIYEDQPYTFLFVDKQTGAYHSRIQNVKFYKLRPCIDPTEWHATTPRLIAQ